MGKYQKDAEVIEEMLEMAHKKFHGIKSQMQIFFEGHTTSQEPKEFYDKLDSLGHDFAIINVRFMNVLGTIRKADRGTYDIFFHSCESYVQWLEAMHTFNWNTLSSNKAMQERMLEELIGLTRTGEVIYKTGKETCKEIKKIIEQPL